ncbi:MAG: hypothetical protein DRZ90_08945 [Spirochaetes bacterium]|nr:MAG: hypothetical protein DRZ90_08945 [Spirochaetota bacterium]
MLDMNKQISRTLSHLPLPPADRVELYGFCRDDADRFELLVSSLKRREIPFEIIPLEGARHIALPVPNASKMDGEYFRVTLVAHYDRVPGTPGANDNAAAVFQLLNHWEEINRLGWHHRTQILFTDREELTGDMTATDQGSWLLAKHLKRLGTKNILFFVLDMCGIGDTPVWGRSVRKAGGLPAGDSMSRSYHVMEGFLKRFTRGDNFGMNPMFSDDLGLLLGGFPAVQLSLLPRKQAEVLARRYSSNPHEADPETPARAREEISTDLPPAWKNNHGPDDSPETLDAGAFNLISRLLRDLARYRFPT